MLFFSSGNVEEVAPTFWAIFAHDNGILEVYFVSFVCHCGSQLHLLFLFHRNAKIDVVIIIIFN